MDLKFGIQICQTFCEPGRFRRSRSHFHKPYCRQDQLSSATALHNLQCGFIELVELLGPTWYES